MKITKFLVLLSSVAMLLVTGCGENALKKEEFNIDPASPTVNEETKACYEKLVNTCKAETKAWSLTNKGMFTDNTELEIKVYEYEHYKLIYNEYFKFIPSSTQTLLNDYQNQNFGYIFDMYEKVSSLSYWCMNSKLRFPDKLEQLNTIQSNTLNMVNNASDQEKKGFDVFFDVYLDGSFFFLLTYDEYNPTFQDKIKLDQLVLYIPVELTAILAYDLTPGQINDVKAFFAKYGDDVKYFNKYLINTTYEMYGHEPPIQ